jgi:hypothetical protein
LQNNILAAQPLPVVCNTHYMFTPHGLQDCKVAEFDRQKYTGLNKNHANSKHVSLKPTNVGDPNKKR